MPPPLYRQKGFESNGDFVRATIKTLIVNEQIKDMETIKKEVLKRCEMTRFMEKTYKPYIQELLGETIDKIYFGTEEINTLTDEIYSLCYYCLMQGTYYKGDKSIINCKDWKDDFTKQCITNYTYQNKINSLNISKKIYDVCFIVCMYGYSKGNEEDVKNTNDKNEAFRNQIKTIYNNSNAFVAEYRNQQYDILTDTMNKVNSFSINSVKVSPTENSLKFSGDEKANTSSIIKFEHLQKNMLLNQEASKRMGEFEKEFQRMENKIVGLLNGLPLKLYYALKIQLHADIGFDILEKDDYKVLYHIEDILDDIILNEISIHSIDYMEDCFNHLKTKHYEKPIAQIFNEKIDETIDKVGANLEEIEMLEQEQEQENLKQEENSKEEQENSNN